MLNVIDAVWANIKIDYKLIDTNNKNTNELNFGGLDKPVLSQNDESKYFNLQIVLLFWWSKFEKYFQENSDIPSINQNKDLRKFISSLNKYLPKSQNISLDEIKLDKVVAELFCTDFFRIISKVLLYNIVPETTAISNPEAVIGIVVGLILENNKIIRTNLAKLMKINNKITNGVFGILFCELSLEKEIKTVWKKAKIRSDLTLNILSLISKSKNTIYDSCLSIWEQYWSSAQLVSNLVSLLNKDLTNVRVFADLFNADYKLTSIVFALASKNVSMLSKSYNEISKRLEINWDNAVKIMVETYWGEFDSLYEFFKKNQHYKNIDKDKIIELLTIINLSMQAKNGLIKSEIPSSLLIFKNLWNKIFEAKLIL